LGSVFLSGLAAVALPAAEPAGVAVVDAASAQGFRCVGTDGPDGDFRTVEVAGMPFAKAVRVACPGRVNPPYKVELRSPDSIAPVRQGDLVYMTFAARSLSSADESGEARVAAYLQLNRQPWAGIASEGYACFGSDWRTFHVSGTAKQDFAAGDLQVTFHLGFQRQAIEIGGLRVLNLGPDADPAALPRTAIDYAGRAPDAPWRADAQARIDRIRRGDLRIQVLGADGRPLPGANVAIHMRHHLFGFGCFNGNRVGMPGADNDRIREHVLRLFNQSTVPVYWTDWGWEKPGSAAAAIKTADWYRENGIRTRGHALVWPGWKWLPKRIKDLADDPGAVREEVLKAVTDITSTMKPHGLALMDVVNEPINNHDLLDLLGEAEMAAWFKAAHDANPDLELYLNECHLLTGGGFTEERQEKLEGFVRLLRDHGAPIHGLGFQGHFGQSLTPPDKVLRILDRFAATGLDLEVTEFDINLKDEQVQADYTRDFLTAVFSHPAVTGFTMWGFWEGDHWRPDGAMYRKDWTPKPNAQAYIDLVLGKWRTPDADLVADADGFVTLPAAYHGVYQVTVGAPNGEEVQLASHRHGPESRAVVVRMATAKAKTPGFWSKFKFW